MNVKVVCYPTVFLGALMAVTGILAVLHQPFIKYFEVPWDLALPILALLLIITLARRAMSGKFLKPDWLVAVDVLFILLIYYFRLSGTLQPGFELSSKDLSGSFGYYVVFPALVFFAGLFAAKDAINLYYSFSSKGAEIVAFYMIRFSAILTLLILAGIFAAIFYKGMWAISWEFLTTPHFRLGQKGGISTCIQGSFWLVIGAMLVSAPLGLGASIYLNEYSRNVKLKQLISIAVGGLNGVPSVVYGLFGLAILVSTFGISLLAGSIILGFMNLPTIILTSQEALKSVPNSLREGSVALGASKWQTIQKVVLPSALPGILTGMIIGVARAAGETAPIMWTAVTFTATPVRMIYGVVPDVFQPVNNLCYHLLQLIYFLGAWDVETNAWGTALVLVMLVLFLNLAAIFVRNYYRKKVKW